MAKPAASRGKNSETPLGEPAIDSRGVSTGGFRFKIRYRWQAVAKNGRGSPRAGEVHLHDQLRNGPVIAHEVLRAAREVRELRRGDVDPEALVEGGGEGGRGV